MKFNLESYKKNFPFLFISIISVTSLILINGLLNNIKPSEAKVEDKDIDIHKLVINEIMTSNDGVYIDEQGNSYDWLEIYNGSGKDVNLTNYGLSDKEDGTIKWLFPNVTMPNNSYLIVYLSGEKTSGLYANFSLKREGGETISLKSPNGKIIDTVKTVEVSKNSTMARDSIGNWIVTSDITPGYKNNEEGRNEFLSGIKALGVSSSLSITEVLPANEGNIIFKDNKLYSYIELTNTSSTEINLYEYYLSNDETKPYKWRLPNTKLSPGKSYLVFTNELDDDNNANFRLKTKTGSIILSNKDGLVERVNYEELTKGIALVKENDKWYKTSNVSPGYPNNSQGKINALKEYDQPKQDIIISEVMSSNSKYLAQNGNQFYDWIELYNNSSNDINLGQYKLTKDYDDPNMFTLPNVTLKPHQYYVIMASGNPKLSNSTYKHANFKLSSGTGLFLYKASELIDSMYIYSIPIGSSYGRNVSFGHYYYSTPTPNRANESNGSREIAYTPVFSKNGGVYNNVNTLEVELESNGTIYYTTDGSIPNTNSRKYTSPIKLNKTTTIRAISYENSKKSSEVVTNTYFVNENHSLPVMSISMNPQSFNKIHANSSGHGTTKAHVEFYEKGDNFSIDCGFKLFGGSSRQLPKKSFALKFNSEYSGHSLIYKVFDNKELLEFNTLVLRSGSQDQSESMMRDEFASTMAINYGTIDAQAAKPIVLYINGRYWGVYFIREKINDKFIQNNYNVQSKTNVVSSRFHTEKGTNKPFVEIKNYINSHPLSINEYYQYTQTKIDVDNIIDYWAYQFIINNTDIHNIRYYTNSNVSNGRIKTIMYDTDYALRWNYGSRYLSYIQYPNIPTTPPDTTYIANLFKNPEFKKKFVSRVSYYLRNVWTQEHIDKTYNDLYNAIAPEMKRNCARWNQSYEHWQSAAKSLKNTINSRRGQVKTSTKSYFKLSQEEFNEYFA